MKKIRSSSLLAATLLAIAGQSAQAGISTASASYSMNFHVVDLTPDDGIAAGFTISEAYLYGNISVGPRWGDKWVSDEYNHQSEQADSLAGQYQGGSANASHSISGGSVATDFVVGSPDGDASANSNMSLRLLLAPNTALVVSGRYDITADVNRGEREWRYVNANGGVHIYADGGGYYFRKDAEYGNYSFQNGSIGDHYSFSLANTGDTGMEAYISTYMSANSRKYLDSIPAVPEPSTWLMLGAGLAVAGAAARRRQRQG